VTAVSRDESRPGHLGPKRPPTGLRGVLVWTRHSLELSLSEIIKNRIAHFAFVRRVAWPLRMLLGLRPTARRSRGRTPTRPDLLHQWAGTRGSQVAVKTRDESGATLPWIIHHVDCVTLPDKIIGPTRAAVRCLQQAVGSLPPSSCHKHDGMCRIFFGTHTSTSMAPSMVSFPGSPT
jgi:hypothetical protein